MLSQENINKLYMNGLYKCNPNAKYRGKIHENDLYHCCNWTFRVRIGNNEKYYMVDTYWSTGDNLMIEITDDNINEFTFIADMDDLIKINDSETDEYKYEDVIRLSLDSGGVRFSKPYILKGTEKSKDAILEKINFEINSCKRKLESLNRDKEMIINNIKVPEWY